MSAPADWYPDTAGPHELRYWSGREWTTWVSDKGVVAEAVPSPSSMRPVTGHQTIIGDWGPNTYGPPAPPPTTTSRGDPPKGWYSDPTGKYEQVWWDGLSWGRDAIPIRPPFTPDPSYRFETGSTSDPSFLYETARRGDIAFEMTPELGRLLRVVALMVVAALPWILISSAPSGNAWHTLGVFGVVLEVVGVVIAIFAGAFALFFGAVHTAQRVVVYGLAGVIGATAYAAWKAGKWLSQNVPAIIDRGLTKGAVIDIEVNGVVHEHVRVVEVIHTYESDGKQSVTAVRVMEQQRTVRYSVREITRIRIAG